MDSVPTVDLKIRRSSMYLSESLLINNTPEYGPLYKELDRCLAKLSTKLYNGKRYRTCLKTEDYNNFLLLSDYKEILEFKQHCSDCLSEYPLSQIIPLIHKTTNKIF